MFRQIWLQLVKNALFVHLDLSYNIGVRCLIIEHTNIRLNYWRFLFFNHSNSINKCTSFPSIIFLLKFDFYCRVWTYQLIVFAGIIHDNLLQRNLKALYLIAKVAVSPGNLWLIRRHCKERFHNTIPAVITFDWPTTFLCE